MQRWPVESSQIASVGYEAKTSTLEIEFKRGSTVYQYFDVPETLAADLIGAPSVGRFFGQNIKGVFRYAKVEVANASTEAQASAAAPKDSQTQASAAAASPDDSTNG